MNPYKRPDRRIASERNSVANSEKILLEEIRTTTQYKDITQIKLTHFFAPIEATYRCHCSWSEIPYFPFINITFSHKIYTNNNASFNFTLITINFNFITMIKKKYHFLPLYDTQVNSKCYSFSCSVKFSIIRKI